MAAIFSRHGTNELARLAALPALLAFDLDGTLAPIVPTRDDARVPDNTSGLLKALSRLWPIAIITGRAVEDARERIGYEPHYLYGNHGAERGGDAVNGHHPDVLRNHLSATREHLRQNSAALVLHSIDVEDKGLSLALHYPKRCETKATGAWLDKLLVPVAAGIQTSHGHQVMNITPRQAPDKGDALLEIMLDCGAVQAFMMGDDVNDECAFAKAPMGSVTVRVGSVPKSTRAQFRLSSQLQVDRLLSTLLTLRG